MIQLDRDDESRGEESGKDPEFSNRDDEVPDLLSHQTEEVLKLQNSDHHGMQLIAAPLTSTNFLQWS